MATPIGIAVATRQAASGYARRALPRRKTYTTSWDINFKFASVIMEWMGRHWVVGRRFDVGPNGFERPLFFKVNRRYRRRIQLINATH
jgi:hypothetical protein